MAQNERLFTRPQVCDTLGVTPEGLRMREEAMCMRMTRKDSRDRPCYRESEIRLLEPAIYSADMASKVFAALDSGTALNVIVVQLGVHPTMLRIIQAQWLEMKATFVVTPEVARKIGELPLSGEFPITSGEGLLEVLTENIALIAKPGARRAVPVKAAPESANVLSISAKRNAR
jgi:hypothetical protein